MKICDKKKSTGKITTNVNLLAVGNVGERKACIGKQ